MSVKGLHYVRVARPGKPIRWYVYAYRGGPRILQTEGPAKPRLTRPEIEKLLAALPREDDETLGAMVRKYRVAPEWLGLEASTRATWGPHLDEIETKWGKTPIALWSDHRMIAKIMDWRDGKAATPRAADIGITVLSRLLEWCRLRARVRLNIAKDIPQLYRNQSRAEVIWNDDDVRRFREEVKDAPQLRDILDLAITTGFRRADLRAVTIDEVGEHAIVRIAKKKSRGKRRRAAIPITPELRAVIDRLLTRHRAEGVRNLLVTSRGQPWAEQSISTEFHRIRDKLCIAEPAVPELGLPARKKHLHDCRGTFVTMLCRFGLTDKEIADIAAWSVDNVSSIRKTYVDDAAIVVALAKRISQSL